LTTAIAVKSNVDPKERLIGLTILTNLKNYKRNPC
jgi:hypothetical protein